MLVFSNLFKIPKNIFYYSVNFLYFIHRSKKYIPLYLIIFQFKNKSSFPGSNGKGNSTKPFNRFGNTLVSCGGGHQTCLGSATPYIALIGVFEFRTCLILLYMNSRYFENVWKYGGKITWHAVHSMLFPFLYKKLYGSYGKVLIVPGKSLVLQRHL